MTNGQKRRLLLVFGALDRFQDDLLGGVDVHPVADLHPLAGFQILVVLEEVLDLLERDFRKIGVIGDLVVTGVSFGTGTARIFSSMPPSSSIIITPIGRTLMTQPGTSGGCCRSERRADRHPCRAYAARNRNCRIGHRGIEKAIDDERAGILVHLVLDRLATNRNFNDDVDVFRRVLANGNCIDTHVWTP